MIGLSAIASLIFHPFSFFSSVVTGLVVLRKGPLPALQVLLSCFLLLMSFVLLAGMDAQTGIMFFLIIYPPVYICCCVLRRTESQGWLVLSAGIISTIYILSSHVLLEDVSAWWLRSMEMSFTTFFNNAGNEGHQDIMAKLPQLAPIANAILASSIAISVIITGLVARWWQSILFKPGGFRTEFHALKLPEMAVCLPLSGLFLLYFSDEYKNSAGLDILVVVVVLYLFQGLASVHRTVAVKHMSSFWLVVMYVLLFFLPQMILLVAILGMIDLWARRRDNSLK